MTSTVRSRQCESARTASFLPAVPTEVGLLRENVLQPGLLVDINDLQLDRVADLLDGGLPIGAAARMSDAAPAPRVVDRSPVVTSTAFDSTG